jgi:methylated-DNA-protein-cysteine methyltransferase-like protein
VFGFVSLVKISSPLNAITFVTLIICNPFIFVVMEDSFFDKVHQLARQIPYGRVSTYGAIAKHLGMARSARMVGWAMNASHNLDDVPAHRVVNRIGLLSGKHHFEGTNLMQQLLESEGIQVKNNQVVDFEKVFWDAYI